MKVGNSSLCCKSQSLNWGYDVKVLFATGFQNWEGALTETSQKTCLAYGIYSLHGFMD